MLVFFDESGDSGMKGKEGSSRIFIVTAVLFNENEDAEQRCDAQINNLRKEMKVHEHFEFHFNKCCDRNREQFLATVAGSNFFYYSVVLNKAKLWGEGFQYKDSFYKYAANLVFENAKAHLIQAKVVMDKCGNRDFRKQLEKYLKRRMNEGQVLIKKVCMEPSHSNNLLQLADMVCGAVFRSFDITSPNRMQFRKIIRPRELKVQVWPR